jgi:hypothetical protein
MSEFRGAEDVMAAAGGGGGASISSDAQSTQTSWASLGKYLWFPMEILCESYGLK